MKMNGSVLEEKSFFEMLRLLFSSKLGWGIYIVCVAKTTFEKIRDLIRSKKFLSLDVALYLSKFTIRPCMEYCCHVALYLSKFIIRPCMEYCCHVWGGGLNCYYVG